MSEFEKELEKNMKLRKVAYERESIDSDYFVSKWDIERIFKGWQPPKPLVVVPQIIGDWIELIKQRNRNVLALLDSDDMPCDVYDWLFIQEDDENIKLILIAWVKGYTVNESKFWARAKKTRADGGVWLVFPKKSGMEPFFSQTTLENRYKGSAEDIVRIVQSMYPDSKFNDIVRLFEVDE